MQNSGDLTAELPSFTRVSTNNKTKVTLTTKIREFRGGFTSLLDLRFS